MSKELLSQHALYSVTNPKCAIPNFSISLLRVTWQFNLNSIDRPTSEYRDGLNKIIRESFRSVGLDGEDCYCRDKRMNRSTEYSVKP